MALDIGELVGRLIIDDRELDSGLSEGEKKWRKFSGKVTALTALAGTAAAAALVAGFLRSMDQADIGAKLSAQMGGTVEDAKNYGALAGKLYAENWGESLEDLGATISAVAKAHILPEGTPEELEDVSRRAQIFSDVFDQDVGPSIKAVQQLINTGLAPDAASAFDLIASGFQGGLDESEDLLDTINEYSTQFRELGLTGAQAFGLIQQGLQGGARDTDIVADALKEFAIRSKDGSTTSAEGFKAIGLNAKQMTAIFAKGGPEAGKALDTVLDKLRAIKDPAERDAAAVALFGTQSEDLGNALFGLDLTTISDQFANSAGSIEKAGNAIGQTDSAKLAGFKRQAEGLATSLAADLIPSLDSVLGFVKENSSWLKPLAGILLGVAAAITVVNVATKIWAATEAAFATIKAAAVAVQWAWNLSLYAFPGVWIVAAIIAIVAIIVLIATKTTWFQQLWEWVWGGIKAAALAVWDWIKGTLWPGIVSVFSAIGNAAVWLWNQIKTYFGKVWDYFISVKNAIGNIFGAIGDFIAAGINRGRDAVRNAVNIIIGLVNHVIGSINGVINLANKVPGVNIGNIGTIPKFASGGVVSPRPGGTPVIMGDGGQVEYGVPKSDMRAIIGSAVRAGAGSGHADVRVQVELVGDGVLKVVRQQVHRKGLQTLEQTP